MRTPTSDLQVLVVSDQQESELLWAHSLEQRSLRVATTRFDADPRQIVSLDAYQLIILDIQDERARTLAICRYARATFPGPILLFTYEFDERFHLEAYRIGIDECIVKPIGNALAVAKVLSWLRQTLESPIHRQGRIHSHTTHEVVRNNHIPRHSKRRTTLVFDIDMVQRLLTTPEGTITRLSKLECRLFSFLIDHPCTVVSPTRLMKEVWEGDPSMNISRLKNLVYRLRKKIEPDPDHPRYLHTVTGHGYRFDAERCK